MRAPLYALLSLALVNQLVETAQKRVSVSVFNDSPTPVSVHFVDVYGKLSVVLPMIAAGGRRNMDSFEHHRFRIQPTLRTKYGPGEWINPSGLSRVFVTARVKGKALVVEVGCQSSNGNPGKCDAGDPRWDPKDLTDATLHSAIARDGGFATRDNKGRADTATPELLFHNQGSAVVDVFWMNVNKRFVNIKGLAPGLSSHVGTHTGHVFMVVRQDGGGQSCTVRAGHFNQEWTIRDAPDGGLDCTPDLPSPFRLALHNQLPGQVSYTVVPKATGVGLDATLDAGQDTTVRLVEGDTLRFTPGNASYTMSGTDALLAVVPVGEAVAGDLYGRIQGTSEAFQLKAYPRYYNTSDIDISDEHAACRKGREAHVLSSELWQSRYHPAGAKHLERGTPKVMGLKIEKLADFGRGVEAWRVPGFISASECEYFENATQGWSSPATTAVGISEARVAFSTNVYYEHHLAAEASVVNRVIARVFALARYKGIGKVTPEGQEPLNMIEYTLNEHYKPHCDQACGGEAWQSRDRVATMVMYCKAATQGGGTAFTNANLLIHGRQGDALLFRYRTTDTPPVLDPNAMTEHTGCPVLAGEKKIITQWIREGVTKERDYDNQPWGKA